MYVGFITISHSFLRFATLTGPAGGNVTIFAVAGVVTCATVGVVLAAVTFAAVKDGNGLGFAVVTTVGADVTLTSFL